MINLGLNTASLEEAIDVIAEILLSPEFGKTLAEIHERARRKIPLRYPEYVYTEDVQTPDGYPCCELVAIDSKKETNTTATSLENEISCQWTVNGDDEQTMGREIKRLIDATRKTFDPTVREGFSLRPQIAGTVRSGDADFGPILAARQNDQTRGRFVKSASIAIFWQAYLR